MGFSLNPVALAKAELLKYKDKKGVPIAVDILEDAEASFKAIGNFLSHFDAKDIEAILALLPAATLAKIPPEVLAETKVALAALPEQLKTAEAALVSIEASLK